MATNNKRPIPLNGKMIDKPKTNFIIGHWYISDPNKPRINALKDPFVITGKVLCPYYDTFEYIIRIGNAKNGEWECVNECHFNHVKPYFKTPKTTTKVGKTNKPNIDLILT